MVITKKSEHSCTIEWEDIKIEVEASTDYQESIDDWYNFWQEPIEEDITYCQKLDSSVICSGYTTIGNKIFYEKVYIVDVDVTITYIARIEYGKKRSKQPEETLLVDLIYKWKPLD